MRRRLTRVAASVALLSSTVVVALVSGGAPARATGGSGDQVIYAAGDIARGAPNDAGTKATGALLSAELAKNPGAKVLMLGDGAYPGGAYSPDYTQYYGNTGWGSALSATLPVPGNHDYGQVQGPSDAGYRQYFDSVLQPVVTNSSSTLDDASGWWSTTLGAWHIVGLNWNCGADSTGCTANGRQGTWLSTDLAKNPTSCTLALWHGARFFSFNGTPTEAPRGPSIDSKTDPYWKILQGAGADVAVGGHQHVYERFDHMSVAKAPGATDHQGTTDPAGMRQFVVGTGGGEHGTFQTNPQGPSVALGSQVRVDNNFGVLKMVLHDGSYDWQFLSAGTPGTNEHPPGNVLDSGSDTCHHAASSGTGGSSPPTTPTTSPASNGSTTTSTGPTNPPAGHRSGYWMVGADGRVYPFGDSKAYGNAAPTPGFQAVDVKATSSGDGYWIIDGAGKVSALGDATFHGQPDAAALRAGEHVTSLSPTASGAGYWIFTDQGRVLPFGDAVSYGDMSGTKLNGPVLGSIPTPSGKGYYMVASDGGIFAFGDAVFQGSMGGRRLNAPVEALVPAGPSRGYWLVASDGGIFAFGGAPFRGSMGAAKLNRPVVGMVPFADGYLMVASDGGIFNFSNGPFLGSLGATPPARPIVAVAALHD
jgi:hypothetical protein